MSEQKTHASLFTGIGGFDLAAQWMGWENVFQCEIDLYCNKLLKQNFPNTIKHGNIKETDFTAYRGTIGILSGGFPCQPYSTAGKRLGKEDERHLWPEMLRAVREIQPCWIVGENVRGLTNWNGGLVFDEVQFDLENEGYEVLPFLLPVAGINAPHERYRIFFIAYSYSHGYECRGSEQNRCTQEESESERNQREWARSNTSGNGPERVTPNPNCKGLQGGACGELTSILAKNESVKRCSAYRMDSAEQRWEAFPTQSPICGGDDGISNRIHRIKALGNAVVPQLVLQIFKAIEAYEKLIAHEC